MGTRVFFQNFPMASKRFSLGRRGMKWKTEAIPSGCLKAAQALDSLPWLKDFYLAGGTALALYYGHRLSVDLDFFSPKNDLGFTEREAILESLRSIGSEIEEEKNGTVHAR